MFGVVIATHGIASVEMLKSAELIIGEQEKVTALTLEPQDNPLDLKAKIVAAADEYGNGNAIILVDILGGTPCNSAVELLQRDIPVITGVNIPMLLEVFQQRMMGNPLDVVNVIKEAKNGVVNLGDMFGG